MGWTIYDAEGRPLIVQQDHDEVTIAADAAHSLSAQELAAVIAATGQTGHMSGTLWDKLDGIEAGADVTDAGNVDAAGAVLEADFNATTFLYATSDDTPQPKTPAEVMAILSGQAAAAFAMNSKKITGLAAGGASGEAVEFDQLHAAYADADAIAAVEGEATLALSGAVTIAGSTTLEEFISTKSTLTIDGNDEVTVPLTSWLYLTSAGATDSLDGIGAGVEGQRVYLTVVAGKDITLVHNGTVTAGKKLMINGEADVLLDQDHDMVVAVFDAVADVWKVMVPGAGGGNGVTGLTVLDRDLNTVDVANTTDETSIYSHIILANELGLTGGVRLTIGGDMLKAVSGVFAIKIKLGATTVLSSNNIELTNVGNRYKFSLIVWFLNSDASNQKWNLSLQGTSASQNFAIQKSSSTTSFLGSAQDTSTEDTTSDRTLEVTVKWGTATANLSFRKEEALLEKIPAA